MGKKIIHLPISVQLEKALDNQDFGQEDVYIGIDPGIEGAIAVMRVTPKGRMKLHVFDIPVITERRKASATAMKARRKLAKKKNFKKAVNTFTDRKVYDFADLANFFRVIDDCFRGRTHVLVERAVVTLWRPGAKKCMACKRQYGQTAYTGIAVGIANAMWPMLLHYLGLDKRFNYVDAQKWKKAFGLTRKEKGVSRSVASNLFKRYNDYFVRVKDHNRAEAAILAAYAWKHRDEVFNAHVSVGGEEG